MSSTAEDMARDVGREGTLTVNGLAFRVRVLDAKFSYGRRRWLVEPLSGGGASWTELVVLDEEKAK